MDLGKWAAEDYRIPEEKTDESDGTRTENNT